MTDEQWVWLFINQSIDNDEQLEGMCDKCKNEVTSKKHCNRCGTVLSDSETFINPNFDKDRFKMLNDDDFDYDLVNQLKGVDHIGGEAQT